MKKRLLATLCAAALTIGLTACGGGGQQAGGNGGQQTGGSQSQSSSQAGSTGSDELPDTGKLILYSPLTESMIDSMLAMFEEDTGIEAECLAMGTGDALKRIQTEAGNPQADILWSGTISTAKNQSDSSAFEHLVNMLYAMGGGDTEEDWDYVRKFCEQLDGKMLGGSSAVYKGVADGEYTVGLTFEQGSAQYVGAGAPVKTVYMEEGVIFRGDGVYIIKDCPNMKSAQIFLDWLTSKEVQEFMNNTQYRRTIRTDVESGDAMVPMEEINVIKDDETNTAEHKAEWLDKFKDIFTQ